MSKNNTLTHGKLWRCQTKRSNTQITAEIMQTSPHNTIRNALHKLEWSDKKVERPKNKRQIYKCHEPYESCLACLFYLPQWPKRDEHLCQHTCTGNLRAVFFRLQVVLHEQDCIQIKTIGQWNQWSVPAILLFTKNADYENEKCLKFTLKRKKKDTFF